MSRESPGAARTLNWRAAGRLVREAPVTGFGGGGFALGAPRVSSAGANAATRAHQGFLELGVEHGLPVAVLALGFVALLGRRCVRAVGPVGTAGSRAGRAAIGAAAAVLVGHALFDFGWSDATWAVPAAAVLGLAWRQGPPRATAAPSLASGALVAALAAVLLVGSWSPTRAAGPLRAGLMALREGRSAEARSLLAEAAARDPSDPRAWAGVARAALVDAAASAGEAVRAARRAVAASPQRGATHAVLARALRAAGESVEALQEAARAAQLAPGDPNHADLRDDLLAELEQGGR